MSIEKRLEKRLRIEVEKRGGVCFKLFNPWFTGLPDRMCLMPGGRIRFAECKDEGLQLTARQQSVRSRLERLGFQVDLVNSDDSLHTFIETL